MKQAARELSLTACSAIMKWLDAGECQFPLKMITYAFGENGKVIGTMDVPVAGSKRQDRIRP